MKSKKNTHHHGDLRAALVQAGVDLIHEKGPDALSIRKVAALAGVSHAAPAHHFPSLVHLRTAIVAHGHTMFTQYMQSEMDAEPDKGSRPILLAAGRGYIKFVVANSALYHLMFGGYEIIKQDQHFQEAAGKSTAILAHISAPIIPGVNGVEGNQLLVWSIIHGFAGIMLNDATGRIDKTTAHLLLEQIFPLLPMSE